MENSTERFKGNVGQANEKISKLEAQAMEIIKSEDQKEILEKREQTLRTLHLWGPIK